MNKSKRVNKQCRSCNLFYTGGIKDGKHDRWCRKYSNPAFKAISRCKLHGGYEPKQ